MLNKKILVAAIVGGLFAAGAASAAPLSVTKQYYANEIVFPAGGMVPTAAPPLVWTSGYNYAAGETKYVRVELTGAKFGTGVVAPTTANGSVGAINGLGTSVLTFSVTANTTPIVAADNFNLPLGGKIVVPTKGNVSVKVSVYDQASQAQNGGPEGLLAIGSYDDTVFLTFADSYEFSNEANVVTAGIAADYKNFVAGTHATATAATLNDDLDIVLADPDGPGAANPATTTLDVDGSAMTLARLFANTSKIEVEGDFSAAAATTGVTLGGGASTPAPAATLPAYPASTTKLTWTGVPGTGIGGALVYNVSAAGTAGAKAIQAGSYTANFIPVSADASKYTVKPLTASPAGAIRRDGLELQAPLAQIPSGWISRIALTNTGAASPKYSIKVLGEAGNTITTDSTKLTGTVKPGTTVIDLDKVLTGFSGAPRGTIIVSVEAPDAAGTGTIQGLYQIVNPEKGSISNHVMVRPGSN